MGTYKLNAQELADMINSALLDVEGDFDLDELEKSFLLVYEEQKAIIDNDE